MNSVHQETKPTYVLIVRSPCSHTRNHHHPRQHDHGTPGRINLSHSVSVSKSHLCQSKGNIGGPSNGRIAHGMGQVHHFVKGVGDGGTLDLLQSWQICGIGANAFYITHSSVTCTKNDQCGDRRFEVHCYLKHAIQTLGLSVPYSERRSLCEDCCELSQWDVAVVLLLTFPLERIIPNQMVRLFWFLVLYLLIQIILHKWNSEWLFPSLAVNREKKSEG